LIDDGWIWAAGVGGCIVLGVKEALKATNKVAASAHNLQELTNVPNNKLGLKELFGCLSI